MRRHLLWMSAASGTVAAVCILFAAGCGGGDGGWFGEEPAAWGYHVYGGETSLPGEVGYHPENYGFTLLGSSDVTQTFFGTYTYYYIVTGPGSLVKVDTVEDSNGNYLGTWVTGNTLNHDNVGGSPDGDYCTVGGWITGSGSPGGYILIEPPSPATWIKVHVVP